MTLAEQRPKVGQEVLLRSGVEWERARYGVDKLGPCWVVYAHDGRLHLGAYEWDEWKPREEA